MGDLPERLEKYGQQLRKIACGYGDKLTTRPWRDGGLMIKAAELIRSLEGENARLTEERDAALQLSALTSSADEVSALAKAVEAWGQFSIYTIEDEPGVWLSVNGHRAPVHEGVLINVLLQLEAIQRETLASIRQEPKG